jgi:hypothetical protein
MFTHTQHIHCQSPSELESLISISSPQATDGNENRDQSVRTVSPSRILRNKPNSWREDISKDEGRAEDTAAGSSNTSEDGADQSAEAIPGRSEVKAMAALWMSKTKAHQGAKKEKESAASKLRKSYSVGNSKNNN